MACGRWPNPVQDSSGQHDRRSTVISQVWGDDRSEHFTPIKHDPKPSSGPLLDHVKMVPPARLERALLAEPHFEWDEATVTI